MPLSDDPWIAEHSIISPERLHAIGMTIIFWNQCERILLLIFGTVFNLTPRAAWTIGHDIGDVTLSNKIKETLAIHALELPITELVTHVLAAYDVFRQNRNALAHVMVKPLNEQLLPDDFAFIRMRGLNAKPHVIPSKLEDFRRVALETQIFSIYLWEVYKGLCARRAGQPVTWPPMLQPPELLWKSPPPVAVKQKRQPQSFRGSRKTKKR